MHEIMAQYYYNNPIEAKNIRQAQQKLLDGYFYEQKRLRDNQFILTADELGITQLEKQFDIIPDLTQEDLEFRRQRLLNRNTTKPPFTLEYLEEKLKDLLGESSYNVVMDYPHYAMDIELGLDNAPLYNEIALTIANLKPANITDHLSWIRELAKGYIRIGAALQTGTEMSIYPIFSDKVAINDQIHLAAYYKQAERIKIYPKEVSRS